MKHVIRPDAAADVERAYRWYDRARPGLGDEFLEQVGSMVEIVAANPAAFPVVYRETRRALIRRFPYALFFRIVGDVVVFVACFHLRRHPSRWQSRP